MNARTHIPELIQHHVLDRSRRRCALCVHFDNDWRQKDGQIAHLDRDPSNFAEDNLAFLCLPHHDGYDTKRRQTKNLTILEAKTARNRLYAFIEGGGDLATAGRQNESSFPDMLLVDLVKRIVGSDDLFVGENCSKCCDALLSIRENAHLGKIAVWGRKNALSADLALYPLSPIPAEYWDEFSIEYLHFTDDQNGKTERVRGQQKSERVQNSVTTTIHVVKIPDTIYSDLRFCAHQVEKSWPSSIKSNN
jgi:hypothetical protein